MTSALDRNKIQVKTINLTPFPPPPPLSIQILGNCCFIPDLQLARALVSLAAVFLDVTQRSPKRGVRGVTSKKRLRGRLLKYRYNIAWKRCGGERFIFPVLKSVNHQKGSLEQSASIDFVIDCGYHIKSNVVVVIQLSLW